jgi:GSH-dependent disulfide-bond oxidoreductase
LRGPPVNLGKNEQFNPAFLKISPNNKIPVIVLDRQLQRSAYLAGDSCTIADIAAYPWMISATTFLRPVLGPSIEAMPAVKRWLAAVGEREAVERGMGVPKV